MSLRKSPRIGYVVKRYPRYSETFIVNEILAHEKAGVDLHIFALRPPSDTHFQPGISRVRAGVSYVSPNGKMEDLWRALKNMETALPAGLDSLMRFREVDARTLYQGILLAIEVVNRGIDHLHAHFATVSTSVARIAAALAQITYSITAHAKDIFHNSIEEYDLRIKLREASSVITVSDYNVTYLEERFGADAERVTRIYNGLDLDLFPFHANQDRDAYIVAVGRLVEKKGFGDLVRACALLKDRGVAFSCQIVGAGELDAPLRGLIDEHNLEDCVELVGPRPQSEIVALLNKASVFAAPCVIGKDGNRDGLPTVLLEAMAVGTPCISTDVTGIPEILRHMETGWLVPQNAPSALAEALEHLLDDPALRSNLANQARALIETQFDIHKNAAQVRHCFDLAPTKASPLPEFDHLEASVL